MFDSSRPRRGRRYAATAAAAALAIGVLAAGCSSTTTTSSTGSTQPGSTPPTSAASTEELAGIPTFKVMVTEENVASTGASTTVTTGGAGSGTTTAPAVDASTTTSVAGPTTTAKATGTSMQSHLVQTGQGGAHDGAARYLFDTEDTMPAGLVMIDLVNNGKLDHQVNFFRAKKAEDMGKIDTILASPTPDLALALSEFVGGSNTVAAGGEQKSVSKFEPGTYYLGCFLQDEDGVNHIGHGMIKKITVKAAGSDGGTTAGTTPKGSTPPAADSVDEAAQAETMKKATVGEIKMKDFAIGLPDPFVGKGWYKVTNDEGLQAHEATMVKLLDGKTKQDAIDWASAPSGPPPFTAAGGFGGLDPKLVGWVYFDLTPGTYLSLCFIPNTVKAKDAPPGPPDLKPHVAHGMFTEFTIK